MCNRGHFYHAIKNRKGGPEVESVYYVGIDIDDKFAVASVFYTGMKEPETVVNSTSS